MPFYILLLNPEVDYTMIMPDFKDFPRTGRIIGFDWGARRTGVAVTDETRGFVFVREPICAGRGDDMTKKIADCIKKENVVGVVFGLPLRMDGTESDTTKMVRDAVNQIAGVVDLPICFIDETLTSSTAADENGFHDKKSAHEKLDSASAKIILENAIAVINRQ
jgi:putative Holliday junction resolvase